MQSPIREETQFHKSFTKFVSQNIIFMFSTCEAKFNKRKRVNVIIVPLERLANRREDIIVIIGDQIHIPENEREKELLAKIEKQNLSGSER